MGTQGRGQVVRGVGSSGVRTDRGFPSPEDQPPTALQTNEKPRGLEQQADRAHQGKHTATPVISVHRRGHLTKSGVALPCPLSLGRAPPLTGKFGVHRQGAPLTWGEWVPVGSKTARLLPDWQRQLPRRWVTEPNQLCGQGSKPSGLTDACLPTWPSP